MRVRRRLTSIPTSFKNSRPSISTDPLVDSPEIHSPAPEDPGTAVVEEEAEEEIDKSELLQDWVIQAEEPEPDYEYLPAPSATERKVKDEERRCDRGIATFTNLGGNKSPEPFEIKEFTPFTIATLPPGVESPSPVYLRWGSTSWVGEAQEEPEFMDLWGGFGFRHIGAKHGWNALDRIETEAALLEPQKPEKRGTKYIYSAIDEAPGVGEVKCERKVVVQFETGSDPKTELKDPAPLGIVTSYNVVR